MNKSLVLLLGFFLVSCAKIDDFDKPYALELYTGKAEITSNIKDFESGGRFVSIIAIETNSDGTRVTLSGLPSNEPFQIFPESLFRKINSDPYTPIPTVSGLELAVIDEDTMTVIGFQDMSTTAKGLVRVTGGFVKQGPEISTDPNNPVIIWMNVGALKKLVGKSVAGKDLLSKITREEDNVTVADMDDDLDLGVYLITYRGQPFLITQ